MPHEEKIHKPAEMQPKESGNSLFTELHASVAGLVHEIGNPLNGMETTIQRLEKDLSKNGGDRPDFIASSLHDLRSEIDRLRSILWEMRSLSDVTRINLRPTDLPSLVDEVLKLEAPQHLERGISVVTDWAIDLPEISADIDKLKQALLNLFKNAFEAMPERGVLKVRGFSRHERVVLEIADTGTGIAKGFDVFEPFNSTKPQGMGLGLMIVRQIILAHGGRIRFRSKPEKGTVFRLKLPRVAAQGCPKVVEEQ